QAEIELANRLPISRVVVAAYKFHCYLMHDDKSSSTWMDLPCQKLHLFCNLRYKPRNTRKENGKEFRPRNTRNTRKYFVGLPEGFRSIAAFGMPRLPLASSSKSATLSRPLRCCRTCLARYGQQELRLVHQHAYESRR